MDLKRFDVQFLSHPLSDATPGFGGRRSFSLEMKTSIAAGDTSNSARWSFDNHCGTHVDVPRHFLGQGRTIESYPANFWLFDRVHLAKFSTAPDELIDGTSWRETIPPDCDLLLLKTGWESIRTQVDYWQHNPGLSSAFCTWLKAHRPKIRALGFDFISLTAFSHRDEGRAAHRILLDEPEIIIIEDMRLSDLSFSPHRVTVSPLRVDNADGAPATIFAEVER